MPGFTPGRRWQPAYSPFKKENFGDRALQVLEYSVKGPLFGCRMCGNCLLQETAFICPMECPKGLRSRKACCRVDPIRARAQMCSTMARLVLCVPLAAESRLY